MYKLIAIMILLQQAIFAADPIGRVLATDGTVKATGGENPDRSLSKGSDIFVEETIIVGLDSRAQIRFIDGTLLNLIPETEYRVDSYRYKSAFLKDQASSQLVKGGFRLLSGSIAKKNPGGFEVNTPVATIGLRGTMVEANITSVCIFCGVDAGTATVANRAGSETIGVGERAQFTCTRDPDTLPEILMDRPPALSPKVFVSPEGGLSLDTVQARQTAPHETSSPRTPSTRQSPVSPPPSTEETEGSGTFQAPSTGGASVQAGC